MKNITVYISLPTSLIDAKLADVKASMKEDALNIEVLGNKVIAVCFLFRVSSIPSAASNSPVCTRLSFLRGA